MALALFGDKATLNFPERKLKPATIGEMRAWSRSLLKARTTSRYRGVRHDPRLRRHQWCASIWCHEVRPDRALRLGSWSTEEEAAMAYDRAAQYYFDSEAPLNFPGRAGSIQPADAATLAAESWQCFKATTTSRFRGVHIDRKSGKWVSRISVRGVQRHLGVFVDEHEAALTYDRAAIDAFGDKARPNFHPDTGEPLGGKRLCDAEKAALSGGAKRVRSRRTRRRPRTHR